MKPRLESVRLTDEDIDVWLWINAPLPLGAPRPTHPYIVADRHDADLMLFFVRLGWKSTQSTAYLYIRLALAMDDPANWKTVLVKNTDGTFSEPS